MLLIILFNSNIQENVKYDNLNLFYFVLYVNILNLFFYINYFKLKRNK